MKLFIALSFLSVAGLCLADTALHPRGCIYEKEKCIRDCENGTQAYAPGCGSYMPEPTCEVPNPKAEPSSICDFSACYCEKPTVRQTLSGKCVQLEECVEL